MLWDKTKYVIDLSRGEGRLLTATMHGLIQHMIVTPSNPDTVWSMLVRDSDMDVIYDCRDVTGRLDDRLGIPVGQDKPESLNVLIYESTSNERFELVFKVKEVR